MYAPVPVARAAGQALAVSPAGVQALNTNPWAVTFPPAQPGAPQLPNGLPRPPPDLLHGVQDPDSVERRKFELGKGIDDVLVQQSALLAQKHQAVLEFLRAKNEQQKRHACAAIDQQRMKGEMEVQARFGEQMMQLSQAATRRKLELDKQANKLTMEYSARRAQEELSVQDYDVYLRFFSASAQPLPLPTAMGTVPGANFADVGMPPKDPSRPPEDYSGYSMPPLANGNWQPSQAQTSPSGVAGTATGALVGGGGTVGGAGAGGNTGNARLPALYEGGGGGVAGTAAGGAGASGGVSNAKLATLYLVVHGCYNLLNKDTGILGDVSDPFVQAKVGKQVEKTPTLNNNLNPVWSDKNRFKFSVGPKDTSLDLEVWNSNVFRNDSLGRAIVDLCTLPPTQWHRMREKLADGGEGELEFDVRLEPEPHIGYNAPGGYGPAGGPGGPNGLPFHN
uniref:C2 domain-containing protein n=1 Tax=Alexandrium monilatum TaxID=311494 RepID=A0A7S4Q776_9DINO